MPPGVALLTEISSACPSSTKPGAPYLPASFVERWGRPQKAPGSPGGPNRGLPRHSVAAQRLDDLCRAAYPAQARKDVPHRVLMPVAAGHRILGQHHGVVVLVGGARRALYPELGGDAAQNHRPDAPPAQLQIQIRPVEGAPLALQYQHIAGLRLQIRVQLAPVRRRPEAMIRQEAIGPCSCGGAPSCCVAWLAARRLV